MHSYRSETKKGVVSKRLKRIRSRCKEKNLAYDLDTPWVLSRLEQIEWKCEVTGSKMIWNIPENSESDFIWSIDRIDTKKGYLKTNVRFVTNKFNVFRSDWSDDEIIMLADLLRIYKGGQMRGHHT